MSVIDLKTLSNNELKKKVAELVSVDDWSSERIRGVGFVPRVLRVWVRSFATLTCLRVT